MALTNAQKQAAYRARRRAQGLSEVDKLREKKRQQIRRKAIQQNPAHYKEVKKNNAMCKRASRAQQHESNSSSFSDDDTAPYNSKQALWKAVHRARRALPSSPRKCKAVVVTLAKSIGMVVMDPKATLPGENGRRTDPAVITRVHKFYRSDEISWQSPCAKHKIFMRETNSEGNVKKIPVIKRFMRMSYNEAFQLFVQETDTQIAFTTFYTYKPPEIYSYAHIPQNICLCRYHENMRLLLEVLNRYIGVSVSFRDFISSVTCDQTLKSCMMGQCDACKSKVEDYSPDKFCVNPDQILVTCEQWTIGRAVKETHKWSLIECFKVLKKNLPYFLRHVYVKRAQANYFEKVKNSLDGSAIVLQVDFAENFTIQERDEIQSAHWSHKQCTIFTAYAWTSGHTPGQGFGIVSDHLSHDKIAVFKFLDELLACLTDDHVSVRDVYIFSDGASSQFKQKFLFATLHVFELKYGIRVFWNFFASSHGKGVVDGIGGSLKATVWNRMKAGTHKVATAEEWQELIPVPNTLDMHSVHTLAPYVISVAHTSEDVERRVHKLQRNVLL